MKTILVTGKTEILTSTVLEQISGRFSTVLTTREKERKEDGARVYCLEENKPFFEQLFWAYDFSAVWYFSPWCDGGNGEDGLTGLKEVYNQCKENSIKRLLVISSSRLSEEEMKEEEEILFSHADDDPQTVVLRVPGLLTEDNKKNALGHLFSGLYHHSRKIRIPDIEEGVYEFLPMKDLVGLMKKITLSGPAQGVYHLPGEYVISKDALISEMQKISRRSRVIQDGRTLYYHKCNDISPLSGRYNYLMKDQKQLEFQELYERYRENEKKKAGGVAAQFSAIRARIPRRLIKLIDIVVLFLLAEFLNRFTSDFVYFKDIDVRLIYIFVIATFHGLRAGVAASLAECVVLVFEYRILGVYGLQLFYNVENWIPFALCIVTGAITGYFSDLRENDKALINRENDLLREKYLFLNDMYNVSSEIKDEYRRQILTFDHSYGKIYHAAESMKCDTVPEVCQRIYEILGPLLDNESVALYWWNLLEDKAEQVLFSDSPANPGRKTMSVEMMTEMFGEADPEEMFRNIQLVRGLPMYAVRLHPCLPGDEPSEYPPMIITLWDTTPGQMNDYYANQFEILCRLAGNALDRAVLTEHVRKEADKA